MTLSARQFLEPTGFALGASHSHSNSSRGISFNGAAPIKARRGLWCLHAREDLGQGLMGPQTNITSGPDLGGSPQKRRRRIKPKTKGQRAGPSLVIEVWPKGEFAPQPYQGSKRSVIAAGGSYLPGRAGGASRAGASRGRDGMERKD